MDIFATVKEALTIRQAAEHYGLHANRNGMACCPFHEDRHPSMKLNERYFYCFWLWSHRRCDRPCGEVVWSEQLRGSPEAGTGFWD